MVFVKYKFQVTPVGDLNGIFKGLRHIGEQLLQFLLALEVKFLGLEFHTVFIVHRLTGLNAQQNILHCGILTAQIVGIVGDHQRHSGLTGDPQHALVHRLLLLDAVILQLKVEIAFSKDAFHLAGIVPGIFVFFIQQILLNTACQAGRQSDQTLVMLLQQRNIHTGLAIETVHKGFRHQQAQIFITLTVLAQQNQVVRIVIDAVDTVTHQPPGHIDLTADDRLDACCFGSLVKIDAAVHNTVVCDRNGALSQLLDPLHHSVDAAGAVQEAIFGMHMQVSKTHITPPSMPAPAS